MTTLNTDETPLRNLQDAGRRFARAWSEVGPEITGTLPQAGQAALARLRRGDCLQAEADEGLQLIGQRIVDIHDRLVAEVQGGIPGNASRQAHKALIEVLMLSFLAFSGMREKVLGQGLGRGH